ncbi:GNAT family N-acetyltransferase [Flavobacterium zepuense]|uniref:GNAT family N-acetyltransferase n=1 Tax=Flavobacterium zepuense TaxID=2593302 RepID=A0A552UXM2_9FLAO|nr:GNAT family N-acetyltransferase [Flavobacterium zepuense]TRW22981.1 GNAT family N-acetyltransferase [Flavobacterium zepuense]
MYTIERYSVSYYNEWNNFVSRSKNGTFLFHRDFMEYHSDRFTDFSLLVFEGQKIVAQLPANRVGNTVFSHKGLTYGGLILNQKIKLSAVLEVFKAVLQYLDAEGVVTLNIKTIPVVYHLQPAQEMEYALFLANAKLTRRDSLAVIDNSLPIKIAANRMEGVKKGIANGFTVIQSHDFEAFWQQVLIPNLQNRHGAAPVHSAEEITKLAARFPDNIKLFIVNNNGHIAAGTVIFETETVAHAQYISAGDDKGLTGSLDFLYHYLVTEHYANKKYFDFGISNEEQGRKLNNGLAFWKESFGARTMVQDFYEVQTVNYILLDNVLV